MKWLPSELEAKFVVPAVRRAISLRLIGQGMSQTEIAHELGITQSAISQYLNTKRGQAGSHLSSVLDPKIDDAVETILKSRSRHAAAEEITRICMWMRKERILCTFHESFEPIPKNCSICRLGAEELGKELDHVRLEKRKAAEKEFEFSPDL